MLFFCETPPECRYSVAVTCLRELVAARKLYSIARIRIAYRHMQPVRRVLAIQIEFIREVCPEHVPASTVRFLICDHRADDEIAIVPSYAPGTMPCDGAQQRSIEYFGYGKELGLVI